MPSYSGVWTLAAQYQAIGGQNWPMAPGAPTSVSATAGDAQATVTFVAPTFTGVPPGITGYLATSTPGSFTATGASSPLTVTGLTNGTSYTIAVQATNGVQYGPAGTSGSVTPTSPRGLFAGGNIGSGTYTNVIQYVTISSTGNATDFGDLTTPTANFAGCSSSTRGIFSGGVPGILGADYKNIISYVTIASTGNATSFGDLITFTGDHASDSNSTVGLMAAGSTNDGRTNVIQYITIASTGNALDFGDLSNQVNGLAGCGSPTRALFGGGYIVGPSYTNIIEYVTIASAGNATDFGDLTATRQYLSSCSSNTRGLFAGGTNGSYSNVIDYVTIASTGNATDFGDLAAYTSAMAGCSSTTRGLFGGGEDNAIGRVNVIFYVTIATTGNALDFGDLTNTPQNLAACSNVHGGL
jgi:hypothetical protein